MSNITQKLLCGTLSQTMLAVNVIKRCDIAWQ